MRFKTPQILALSLVAASIAAHADTTLDYQGYVMGGTSSAFPAIWDTPTTGHGPVDVAPLVTLSTTATLGAQVVFSGSVAQDNLSILSVNIDVTGNNGSPFAYLNLGQGDPEQFLIQQPGGGVCYEYSVAVGGCVTLTTVGNAVTGATIDMGTNWYHSSASNYAINVGPNGDAFSLVTNGEEFSCTYAPLGATYIGTSGSNAPCNINASNPTAGVWTVNPAPEIDPASAAGGLALLFGGIAVMRGQSRAGAHRN